MIKQPETKEGARKRVKLFGILVKAGMATPEKVCEKLLPRINTLNIDTLFGGYDGGNPPVFHIYDPLTDKRLKELNYKSIEPFTVKPLTLALNNVDYPACVVIKCYILNSWPGTEEGGSPTIITFPWRTSTGYTNKEKSSDEGGTDNQFSNDNRVAPDPIPGDYYDNIPYYFDYYKNGEVQLSLPYPYPQEIPEFLRVLIDKATYTTPTSLN